MVTAASPTFSAASLADGPTRVTAAVICVFSAVVSNFGLDQIVAIAGPILDVVYPPTLALILLALAGRRLRRVWVYRLAALGALAVSLLKTLSTYGGVELPFLDALPLASIGFGWLLPAAVCGVIGALIPGELPESAPPSHP